MKKVRERKFSQIIGNNQEIYRQQTGSIILQNIYIKSIFTQFPLSVQHNELSREVNSDMITSPCSAQFEG